MADPKSPAVIPDVKKELKKPEENKEHKEVREKIEAILKQYNNLEGDIPLNSEYWNLVAVRRAQLQGERDVTPPTIVEKKVEEKKIGEK